MSSIKLFLDEDVWPGLAAVLRGRGFDVVHAYEVEQGGMSDSDQLVYSSQEGRTILTHNAKDFVPLAIEYYFDERSHPGVILSPQTEKGELIRCMLNLLDSLSAEEIADTVRHLADYK